MNKEKTLLHPFICFLAYIVLTLLAGGLLAYPLFLILDPLLDYPFHRFTSRAVMLVALVGLIPFLKSIGSYNKAALGYARPGSDVIQDLLKALAVGTIIFLPIVFIQLAAGARLFDPAVPTTLPGIGALFLKYLPAALFVGVVEETYFRGAIFSAMQRYSKIWVAIGLTSLIYAAVHFLRVRYHIPDDAVSWYSGLVIVGHAFSNYSAPLSLADSFLSLFVAGVFLCLIRLQTGHIGACIGIHAGWVFVIKISKKLTNYDANAEFGWLAGNYDQMIGWLAFAWITLVTCGYYFFFVRRSATSSSQTR